MAGLLWVCMGSAVGGGARYLLSNWAVATFGPGFPVGTLLVNVLGSFLLGALGFAGVEMGAFTPATRLALTTGFLGGFTTYSTFSYETMRLLQGDARAGALVYLALTVAGALGATFLGWATARWLLAS